MIAAYDEETISIDPQIRSDELLPPAWFRILLNEYPRSFIRSGQTIFAYILALRMRTRTEPREDQHGIVLLGVQLAPGFVGELELMQRFILVFQSKRFSFMLVDIVARDNVVIGWLRTFRIMCSSQRQWRKKQRVSLDSSSRLTIE